MGEHQLIDQNVLFAFEIIASCAEEGSTSAIGSLFLINFIFTFVFHLKATTLCHILLADTRSLGCLPQASVAVSPGSD